MIVAGFGFRSKTGLNSLRDAYDRARLGKSADVLATADDKLDELRPLAQELGVAVVGIPARFLEAQETETQSPASLAARNTGSVAEAAALSAAGPGAELLSTRVFSNDRQATCALALGEDE